MDGDNRLKENAPIETTSLRVQDHHYYGPLIESYVRSILKSGLLLDEDLEVLLTISKFQNFPEKRKYRPSLSLLASLTSTVVSFYVARKYQLPLIVLPSVIFTLKVVTTEFKNVERQKANREIINKLIEVISKVHKLNISIIRYMKARNDLGKAKEEEFLSVYNRGIEEFLVETSSRNYGLFKHLTDNLEIISMHSDALFDDYKNLVHLNPKDVLKIDNIENCLALTQKIQDLHVLFASKLLSYIGIVLHSEASHLREQDTSDLLNETLPETVKYLYQYHDFVKKQFVSLRQSVKKKIEYKSQARAFSKNHLSAKLQETLVYSVNNLSIILEKSQKVLDRIENGDEKVGSAIVDLRNHTLATYESLDVLCKLYDILSNSTTTRKQIDPKIAIPVKNDALEEKYLIVNYDDNSESLEEKFELYVGEEEVIDEHFTTKYDEDQSGAYLSLMLQELKQSLKQHQRFIDAKNRRGSEDNEEIDRIPDLKLRKSPPKFDLRALKDGSTQEISVPPCLVELEKPVEPLNLPMPPPPPLPSFSMSNLEEESDPVNARSMLENIKALSSQRNVQEEVFGDSYVDSNNSDSDHTD